MISSLVDLCLSVDERTCHPSKHSRQFNDNEVYIFKFRTLKLLLLSFLITLFTSEWHLHNWYLSHQEPAITQNEQLPSRLHKLAYVATFSLTGLSFFKILLELFRILSAIHSCLTQKESSFLTYTLSY